MLRFMKSGQGQKLVFTVYTTVTQPKWPVDIYGHCVDSRQ